MEAIGAASAIIQIASFGLETAVKLATFADQLKTAPERITGLADDVSLNSSVLKQLGELMKGSLVEDRTSDDKQLQRIGEKYNNAAATQSIFNAEGLEVTIKVAKRCEGLFKSLESSLVEASSQLKSKRLRLGAKIQLSKTERLKWPFLLPEITRVQADLRDSKATLMLMLQIVSLAYSRKVAGSNPKTDDDFLIRSIILGHGSQSFSKLMSGNGQSPDQLFGRPTEKNETPPRQGSNPGGFINATSVPNPQLFQGMSQEKNDSDENNPTPDSASGRGVEGNPSKLNQEAPPVTGSWDNLKPKPFPPVNPFDTTKPQAYSITPKAIIINNMIQIRYRADPIEGDPSVLMNPDLWTDKSKGTVSEQWAALSMGERMAIMKIEVGIDGVAGPSDLKWIHTGEPQKLPLEVPSARSITVLVKKARPLRWYAPPPVLGNKFERLPLDSSPRPGGFGSTSQDPGPPIFGQYPLFGGQPNTRESTETFKRDTRTPLFGESRGHKDTLEVISQTASTLPTTGYSGYDSDQDEDPGLENEDGDAERAEELVQKLLNKFTTL